VATIISRQNADGSTSYQVRIRLLGVRESRTFPRRTDAKIWASKRETEIREGHHFGGSRKTLAQAIERYREEELDTLAPGSKRSRIPHLAWWEERRGGTLLPEITRAAVQEDLRALRQEGWTYATANRYKAALGAVLSCAVEEWHWLPMHPLRGGGRRRRPKGEREAERERELSEDERGRLWAACRASRDQRLYALVVCAYNSGARQAELLGLEWSRLHLHPLVYDPELGERRPGVPRAEVIDTKNGESRVLYFPREAGEVLREMARTPTFSRYVFASPGVAATEMPRFPDHPFRKAKAAAKLADFRFHDLRHSWACNLLDAGATLAQLMIQGGWKTPSMVRRYASRAQREGSAAVERLDRMHRDGG
jgi:integrase